MGAFGTWERNDRGDRLIEPLCIRYTDYEKEFGSREYEAIFKALVTIGINDTYITILEDFYT